MIPEFSIPTIITLVPLDLKKFFRSTNTKITRTTPMITGNVLNSMESDILEMLADMLRGKNISFQRSFYLSSNQHVHQEYK